MAASCSLGGEDGAASRRGRRGRATLAAGGVAVVFAAVVAVAAARRLDLHEMVDRPDGRSRWPRRSAPAACAVLGALATALVQRASTPSREAGLHGYGPAAMRVGILTGGGDCPGLNAVIRAVVRTGGRHGHEHVGLPHGWRGPAGARRPPP